MATRITAVRAARAPVAVLFRRGPTKQVRQVLWRLDTDTFQRGQWLAGRIYPERCDLSPDGQLLVYFAMRRGHTWNAVSRPPHFTPLAVWEEPGTWGGGGRFVDDRHLLMRANPRCLELQDGFTLPDDFTLGWLSDSAALPSDPWTTGTGPDGAPLHARARPGDPELILQRRPLPPDPHSPGDRWEALLHDVRSGHSVQLGPIGWCDWGPGPGGAEADLLYTRGGDVIRVAMPLAQRDLSRLQQASRILLRLADDRFCRVPPAPEARQWPS